MNDIWLAHHGIKGQKWGVRRYQNKDGSLTPEGRRHVQSSKSSDSEQKNLPEDAAKTAVDGLSKTVGNFHRKEMKLLQEYRDIANSNDKTKIESINDQLKQLNAERYKQYSNFVDSFEKENGVKIQFFQPLKDATCFSYTDGDKSYLVYKGQHFSSVSEATSGLPNNVNGVLNDFKNNSK